MYIFFAVHRGTEFLKRQLREHWRDNTDKRRLPAAAALAAKQQTGGVGGGNAASKQAKAGNGKQGRSGTQMRATAAKFSGKAVCYLFNSRKAGCPRVAKPGGCEDGQGRIYAHVCNFKTKPGQHCLAVHPRHANH